MIGLDTARPPNWAGQEQVLHCGLSLGLVNPDHAPDTTWTLGAASKLFRFIFLLADLGLFAAHQATDILFMANH